jgi:AraC-like DNA-binding protein
VMFWMLIRIESDTQTLLDLPRNEGAALINKLRNLPHHFRGHRSLKETLYRIFEVHGRNVGALQVLNVRNLLIRYLLDVAHSAEFEDQGQISPEILEVMRFVRENLDRNYMLEDLASRVALSVSRFKARFKEEVGVPPADYVARQKVSRAMDLLRKTGMPITQIATSLGYSSSQYFATAFRRYTGKTPSLARREAYAAGTAPAADS